MVYGVRNKMILLIQICKETFHYFEFVKPYDLDAALVVDGLQLAAGSAKDRPGDGSQVALTLYGVDQAGRRLLDPRGTLFEQAFERHSQQYQGAVVR